MGYAIPDNLPSNLIVYAKMLKVGLAKQSVLNKMAMDGVSEEEFYKYLDPERANASAPAPATVAEDDEFASDDEKDADNPLYAENSAPGAAAAPGAAPAPNPDLLAIEPSKVDMSGMNPMPVKKTLIIVTSFIAESVTFLNRFVATCEDRLHLVEQRMERMGLRMLILENNLNSIDWLRQAPAMDNPPATQATEGAAPTQQNADAPVAAAATGEPGPAEGETGTGPAAASPADALKTDARYALYFKMLKCRVPPPAVRNKMNADKIPAEIQDQILAAL